MLLQGEDRVAHKFNMRDHLYSHHHHRRDPLSLLLWMECAVQHQQDQSLLSMSWQTPEGLQSCHLCSKLTYQEDCSVRQCSWELV